MLDSLSYSMVTGRGHRDGLHQQTQGESIKKPPHWDAPPSPQSTHTLAFFFGHASQAK